MLLRIFLQRKKNKFLTLLLCLAWIHSPFLLFLLRSFPIRHELPFCCFFFCSLYCLLQFFDSSSATICRESYDKLFQHRKFCSWVFLQRSKQELPSLSHLQIPASLQHCCLHIYPFGIWPISALWSKFSFWDHIIPIKPVGDSSSKLLMFRRVLSGKRILYCPTERYSSLDC